MREQGMLCVINRTHSGRSLVRVGRHWFIISSSVCVCVCVCLVGSKTLGWRDARKRFPFLHVAKHISRSRNKEKKETRRKCRWSSIFSLEKCAEKWDSTSSSLSASINSLTTGVVGVGVVLFVCASALNPFFFFFFFFPLLNCPPPSEVKPIFSFFYSGSSSSSSPLSSLVSTILWRRKWREWAVPAASYWPIRSRPALHCTSRPPGSLIWIPSRQKLTAGFPPPHPVLPFSFCARSFPFLELCVR